METWMFLKRQNGSIDDPTATIAQVAAKFDERALALPWETFTELYLKPAFEQLKREEQGVP